MPIVSGLKKLFSLDARGASMPLCQLGTFQPGHSKLGDDDIYLNADGPDPILATGIFQHRVSGGRKVPCLVRFMIPKNPRTEEQQAQRQKMSDAVEAWQNLTTEQKEVYNARSYGKKMSGYNLFLKEYLKSH